MLLTATVGGTFAYVVTGTVPNVNTFEPVKTEEGDFVIKKTVEHPFDTDYKIPDNISFDFTVNFGKTYAGDEIVTEELGNFKANDKGEIAFSLKPDQQVTIKDIVDKTVVTITEKDVENDGFTVKDGAVKTVTVSGKESPFVEFVNVYEPQAVKLDNLTVKGTKTIVGRDWQKGDEFEFVIEQNKEEGGWEELGKKTVKYSSSANFNKFDLTSALNKAEAFTEAGTYYFRVTETEGKLEDMIYDSTANYITVTVGDADMDGKLEISNIEAAQNAVCTKDAQSGKYAVEVSFSNTYSTEEIPNIPDSTATIIVRKTVNNVGRYKLGPADFIFALKNKATDETIARKTDDNGFAEFKLNFAADDIGKTFEYTLSETNDSKAGVTYSTKVYELTVIVGSDGEGNPVAEILHGETVGYDFVAEFENTYNSSLAGTSAPTTGDNSKIYIYIVLALVSAIVLILLFIFKKDQQAEAKATAEAETAENTDVIPEDNTGDESEEPEKEE